MTPQEIAAKLKARFGEAISDLKEAPPSDPFISIQSLRVKDVAAFLRSDPDLEFDYLMCLSGMDYNNGNLGVVYNLYSMTKRHKLTLRVEVPKADPKVPSVESIWRTADWHEREAYDLVGIVFAGHPDLRRILCPYDWEGHPLQKDYKVPEFYQGMKVPY